MKVSISWIFDHIDADWRTIDIPALVTKFNQTTAEIERWYPVTTDSKNLFIGKALSQHSCHISELKKDVELSSRTDVLVDNFYLIKKNGNSFAWATTTDLGGEKDMIVPAVVNQVCKKDFEADDYILEVDNKSITHRPDLWGARGFAREIAAILNLKLKPYDTFLARKPVKKFANKVAPSNGAPGMLIENEPDCKRFAGLYFPAVSYTPSLLWMVTRLSRVDLRSINALVDFTNYVMLDTSQPMHVFDAAKISDGIIVRPAKPKEKLELLDGQCLELSDKDMVIADKKGALSLAGIMGGKASGVSRETQHVFLESANFDPSIIRKTSQHYHVRTEGSTRWEKGLDPMQNVDAIFRFLKLMNDAKIPYEDVSSIASLGETFKPATVTIAHAFIEKRLGVELKSAFIKKTLEKIGFEVETKKSKSGEEYHITIPLFRGAKGAAKRDVMLVEDIVEEIVRFYGYNNIPFVLPERKTKPTDTHAIRQISDIKHQLAFGLSMHELYGYSFFDESFIRTLGWDPKKTLEVKDPVSQNWYRLATTLMPHMFKAVQDNAHEHDELRFFEFGRVWHDEKKIVEQKKLTGIFYNKRKAIDFYDIKAQLNHLFVMIRLPVEWRSTKPTYPWMNNVQVAQLFHGEKPIGLAGLVDATFMKQIAEGHAFIFELDADFLESYQAPIHVFKPLARYPSIERDISMMVPLSITVAELTALIAKADKHIVSVSLVDFFTKKEWKDQKAITLRYNMQDKDATLTGAQADQISAQVIARVTKAGATVR
jgi:phenylalanyl-tRNA synthetase beta chain